MTSEIKNNAPTFTNQMIAEKTHMPTLSIGFSIAFVITLCNPFLENNLLHVISSYLSIVEMH